MFEADLKSTKAILDSADETERKGTCALVIGPYLDDRNIQRAAKADRHSRHLRSHEARIAEAQGLAEAIELDVVDAKLVSLSQIRPGTFLGQGKVDEIATYV